MALLVVMVGVLLKLGTKHIKSVTLRWQESGCASAFPDTAHVSLHCSAEGCPPADEAGWGGAILSAPTPLMQEYAQLKVMNSELKRGCPRRSRVWVSGLDLGDLRLIVGFGA